MTDHQPRYKSKEEAQKDHLDNYRSDGVMKQKGTKYSSDFYRVKFLIDNTPENAYVLDVGCNGGTVGLPLKILKNCLVKGIDLVPELVELSKKRGLFAEVGEAEDLSRFKDNTFDVVICAEVLEHLYEPIDAIAEAYRVLKPGGKYLVTVPHPASNMAQGLGDYHQQNFTAEILDTLFYNFFKRESVKFIEIPYNEIYCKANNFDPKQPQWLGLEAIK